MRMINLIRIKNVISFYTERNRRLNTRGSYSRHHIPLQPCNHRERTVGFEVRMGTESLPRPTSSVTGQVVPCKSNSLPSKRTDSCVGLTGGSRYHDPYPGSSFFLFSQVQRRYFVRTRPKDPWRPKVETGCSVLWTSSVPRQTVFLRSDKTILLSSEPLSNILPFCVLSTEVFSNPIKRYQCTPSWGPI